MLCAALRIVSLRAAPVLPHIDRRQADACDTIGSLDGAVAGSLLLSTLLSALTTPPALAAVNWAQRP